MQEPDEALHAAERAVFEAASLAGGPRTPGEAEAADGPRVPDEVPERLTNEVLLKAALNEHSPVFESAVRRYNEYEGLKDRIALLEDCLRDYRRPVDVESLRKAHAEFMETARYIFKCSCGTCGHGSVSQCLSFASYRLVQILNVEDRALRAVEAAKTTGGAR